MKVFEDAGASGMEHHYWIMAGRKFDHGDNDYVLAGDGVINSVPRKSVSVHLIRERIPVTKKPRRSAGFIISC